MNELVLTRPDDWHLHLRDGAMLAAVLPFTARHFGRAILMPNLVPPVATTKDAIAYRTRVMAALPKGSTFKPLMTCYLTDTTDPADLAHEQHAQKADVAGAFGVKPRHHVDDGHARLGGRPVRLAGKYGRLVFRRDGPPPAGR